MAHSKAFSLIELLIAIIISSILVSATVSVYGLFRRSVNQDQTQSDSVQSARVAMDRLVREIRQTPDIRTVFPADPSDLSVAQPGEIEFEDGNVANPATDTLTYRHYYLTNRTLTLEVRECFFAGQNSRVHWSDVDTNGIPPTCQAINGRTQDIAQNVSSVAFYGRQPLQIVITTTNSAGQSYLLQSSVNSRNM